MCSTNGRRGSRAPRRVSTNRSSPSLRFLPRTRSRTGRCSGPERCVKTPRAGREGPYPPDADADAGAVARDGASYVGARRASRLLDVSGFFVGRASGPLPGDVNRLRPGPAAQRVRGIPPSALSRRSARVDPGARFGRRLLARRSSPCWHGPRRGRQVSAVAPDASVDFPLTTADRIPIFR